MSDGYSDMKRFTEMLLEADILFIAQKAKIKYLQQGDQCTKFFHDLIKRTNKKNSIVALHKLDGSICTGVNYISTLFVEHYKGILGCKVDMIHVDRDTLFSGPTVSPNE